MSIRKIRGKAIILTVLQGLLLLAVLSAMFSTIISLFFSSMMEDGIGSADLSGQAAVSETPAQVNAEEPVPELTEEDAGRMEEMLAARLASIKPKAAVMWFALSLLFLMMALTLKHEWEYNLFRYGIGAVLFACCAVIFLISENDNVYRITAILHMLGLAADHLFSIVKNHKVRNVIFRVLGVLLLGAGMAFDGKTALMLVLVLTIPRIFYYIARISFSQVKLDVLSRIIRKTGCAEQDHPENLCSGDPFRYAAADHGVFHRIAEF